MKKEHIKEILEKYKNGQTSLEEEQFLLNNSTELDFPLSNWINFKRKTKKEVTEDFNESLWESFEKITQPKGKIIRSVLIAAASIVLMFTILNKTQQKNTQSLSEKDALLTEAKSMFSEIEQNTNQEIIFDSDLIILYIKTK